MILLALQCWGDRTKGDWAQAHTLARFIADIQPDFSSEARFLFMYRWDSVPDPETVAYVSKKFPVLTRISTRRDAAGWPYGCNELWGETICWANALHRAGKIPGTECVLTFEADCVPLKVDWYLGLLAEWRKAKPETVMGAWGDFGNVKDLGHINGNLVADIRLPEKVPSVIGAPPGYPWDIYHAKAFKRVGWHPTPLVANYYHKRGLTEADYDQVVESGAVLLHGVKDDSAFSVAKKRLLVGSA